MFPRRQKSITESRKHDKDTYLIGKENFEKYPISRYNNLC